MMRKAYVWLGILVFVISSSPAWATQFVWKYQTVDPQPSTNQGLQVGLSIRVNQTWPTVFYNGTQNTPDQFIAASATPAGWQKTAVGSINNASNVHSMHGPSGQAGTVWKGSSGVYFTQSSSSGWSTSMVNNKGIPGSADYLSSDQPVVSYLDMGQAKVAAYDGSTWNTESVSTVSSPNALSMAVGHQDSMNLAYTSNSTLYFKHKEYPWAAWSEDAPVFTTGNIFLDVSTATSPDGRVGIAMLHQDTGGTKYLHYAWRDIMSGEWQTSLLDEHIDSDRVNLTFNSEGHPALAYVTGAGGDPYIHYRVNAGSGWSDIILPNFDPSGSGLDVTPNGNTQTALAFDGDDNPVVAYYSNNSGLLLAYDPVLTPEPTMSLMLLGGAALFLSRRRSWRV